jgi:hypothetical protein
MPAHGILANQQNELELLKLGKNPPMPSCCALAAGWQIATFVVETWEAKAHGHDRNPAAVIKFRFTDTHPITQPISGRIEEWHAGCVHTHPRCLSADR